MTTNNFRDYETIAFSREGRILTITLNLPDTLNAVSRKLHIPMVEASRCCSGFSK